MGIQIEIDVEPDHVRLRCSGDYSLEEAKRVFRSAIDAALESSMARVLVDVRGVSGPVRAMDRYEIAVSVADYVRAEALGKISKLAVAGHEPLIDPSRFGETVAVNRGVNAKIFFDVDEALVWLLS